MLATENYALKMNTPEGRKRVDSSKGFYSEALYNNERELVERSLHFAGIIRLFNDDDPEQLDLKEQSVRDRVIRIYEGLEESPPMGEEAIRKQGSIVGDATWEIFGFDPVKYHQEEMEEIEKEFEKSQESSSQPAQVVTDGKFTAFKFHTVLKDGKVIDHKRVEVTNDLLPKPVYLYNRYGGGGPISYGCYLFDTPIDSEAWIKIGDSYKTYSEVCKAVKKYNKERGITIGPKEFTFQDIEHPNEITVGERVVYCNEKKTTQTEKETNPYDDPKMKKPLEEMKEHGETLKKGMYGGGSGSTKTSDTAKTPPKDVSRSYPAPSQPGFEVPAALGGFGLAKYLARKLKKKK